MFVLVVEQLRGADRRLAEREPAVIGGDQRMRKHVEIFRLEAADDVLEQNTVLEAAA
jgi:hypothetical protein